MSDKITRLPQIRFTGFTDGWEQHYLSKVGDFLRTSVDPQATPRASFIEYSMPSYDNGRSPETVFGDSMQSMRLKISGDVLLINKLNVRQKRIWFVEDAPSNAVASSEFLPFTSTEIDLAFLEQLMLLDKTTRDLESISSGTSNSQKRITPSDVLKYLIKLPVGRPEQEKIGSFFKDIDNLINLHQHKLELLKETKKSLLQKMFPKEGANVPEIRFAGFTDAWKQRKLGNITERVVRKNKNLDSTLPLTISAQFGLVDQETFFNKVVASKDVSGYYLIKKGEFAYNKSYSKDYPWGAVKRLEKYDMGVLSTLYITFTPTNVNSDFLVHYYDTNGWHKEVAMRATEGARNHGLLNITASDFFDTVLSIPASKEEQKKIGIFFKQLDETITLHQRELNSLENLKKSLLQQMFI